VTRTEALRRCEQLNGVRPEGEPPWVPRELASGDWRPGRPRIWGLRGRTPLKATTEARPKPPYADDPRPTLPPTWGPVGS
jgi:hypothetical protein